MALEVYGYIVVEIETESRGKQRFTLGGTIGDHLKVEYHRSVEEALTIGTISEIAAGVPRALGIMDPDHAKAFKEQLDGALQKLNGPIPGLGTAVESMNVKLTDLGINTETDEYQLGICLDLSKNPLKWKETIALNALGVKVTYKKPPSAEKKDLPSPAPGPKPKDLAPTGKQPGLPA